MVPIYYNPQDLLKAAGFSWIWNLTFTIIRVFSQIRGLESNKSYSYSVLN